MKNKTTKKPQYCFDNGISNKGKLQTFDRHNVTPQNDAPHNIDNIYNIHNQLDNHDFISSDLFQCLLVA